MHMVDLAPTKIGPTWRNGRLGPEGVSKRLILTLGCYHSWIQPSKIYDHYHVCLEWNFSLNVIYILLNSIELGSSMMILLPLYPPHGRILLPLLVPCLILALSYRDLRMM